MVGLGHLTGGTSSEAYGVSSDGSVIVGRSGSTSGNQAFRWTSAGGMVGLGEFPGGTIFAEAQDVSSDGSVVVGQSNSAIGTEAFIWDATNGMRALKTALEAQGLDLTGWTLTSAESIASDNVTIVGYGNNPSGNNEAWIAVIPEPSTYAIIFGLISLGLAIYIKRRWV